MFGNQDYVWKHQNNREKYKRPDDIPKQPTPNKNVTVKKNKVFVRLLSGHNDKWKYEVYYNFGDRDGFRLLSDHLYMLLQQYKCIE